MAENKWWNFLKEQIWQAGRPVSVVEIEELLSQNGRLRVSAIEMSHALGTLQQRGMLRMITMDGVELWLMPCITYQDKLADSLLDLIDIAKGQGQKRHVKILESALCQLYSLDHADPSGSL